MREPFGVGLGWRAELALDLLRSPQSADFVEVVAETCFVQPAARREARAIRELWPVIPHGVKLSLGSAEGIEPDRARALGALAKELRAPLISEHVAFVRSRGREIGHLTALPLTRVALGVVERNVARARRLLPDLPLLLENVAWTFQWPESEMQEGDFYSEVVRRTGCPLLLDVGNLYANAVNSGLDPQVAARRFPLDSVGMIHLAGGVLEHGFYFDDHAHAVSNEVFALLESVLALTGPVPILIERDALFPPFAELADEVERGRRSLAATKTRPERAVLRARPEADDVDAADLLASQERVARLLVDVTPPDAAACDHFGRAALDRSRAVLQRKRVDEALPLLPHLCRSRPALEPLARQVVETTERLPRMAAIGDAIAIANRAREVDALAALAERDALALSARFVRDGERGDLRPRRSPLVSFKKLSSGSRVLALKGFGAGARVHFYERSSTGHE